MLGAPSVLRSTDTSAETSAPLVDSSIHDRLDKASPLVDQMHIKFAEVSYCGHLRRLVKNIGWANQNIGGGKKVVKSDKCMDVSQLLGARARAAPKSYAY